jgi:hypothetical protein
VIVLILLAVLVGLSVAVNRGARLAGACIVWAVYVPLRDLGRGRPRCRIPPCSRRAPLDRRHGSTGCPRFAGPPRTGNTVGRTRRTLAHSDRAQGLSTPEGSGSVWLRRSWLRDPCFAL